MLYNLAVDYSAMNNQLRKINAYNNQCNCLAKKRLVVIDLMNKPLCFASI